MRPGHIALLIAYWGSAIVFSIYVGVKIALFEGFMLASFLILAGTFGELVLIAIGVLRPVKPR